MIQEYKSSDGRREKVYYIGYNLNDEINRNAQ